MNIALLVSSIAALSAALGHSVLGEMKVLRPLYQDRKVSSALAIAGARRIMRAVWHLPSVIWALTGVLTYGFVHHQTVPPIWFVIYASLLYGFSALGNFWGTRRLHLGGIILLIAAGGLVFGALA